MFDSFQIKSDDVLPQIVCHECVTKIETFSHFRKLCETNDRQLHYLFSTVMADEKEEVKIEDDIESDDVVCILPERNDDSAGSSEAEFKFVPDGQVAAAQVEVIVEVVEQNIHTELPVIDTASGVDPLPEQKDDASKPNWRKRVVRRKKQPEITKHRKVCEECGLTFSSNCTLRRHLISHTGRKDFCCSICNNRFARKFHLEMHMRIHLNIRPHVCETCASSFSTSSDLTRHRRIHVDVKNYKCVVCERRFKRSSDVIKHMRTHTGDRPYNCKECEKNYSSHSGLTKHLKRYHPLAVKNKENRVLKINVAEEEKKTNEIGENT